MSFYLPIIIFLAACQVEYADVTEDWINDSVEPSGPVPPGEIIFSRTDMVEPALPWDGVSLHEEVCAFYEGTAISGADMEDIELLSMTLHGGHGGSISAFPEQQSLRIVGLYGSSGFYPSASNVASVSVQPSGTDGNWSATWTASSLAGMNACSPDCYYSGFHLEMRIPWGDDLLPEVACEDFLQMALEFTWYDADLGEL
ncbi:MAG: hypothetical protein P8R54_05250 [Myxococcota bacterium]|nr:hypothetical protein [Myxococcota bacterium]